MGNNENESGKFPLEKTTNGGAYQYLIDNGFENEVKELRIKYRNVKYKGYTSSIRRGAVIELLEKFNLLNDFIKKEWPRGETEEGRNEIQNCKNRLHNFLKDKGEIVGEDKLSPHSKTPMPKQPDKSSKILHQDTHDDLIDNVIRVKTGLRVLSKVLIPYVTNEYKQKYNEYWWQKILKDLPIEHHRGLIKGKLDVSNCLSLLDKCWDEVFKPSITKNFPNKARSVRAYINILKDERNINAHDGIDDITFKDASYALDTMARLCDAFGENEASNNILRIIKTLKK